MDWIRRPLEAVALTRPIYRSNESTPNPALTSAKHPQITDFRLLTILTAILFGMVKAYLSYRSFGAAATTLDWSFGVATTSW